MEAIVSTSIDFEPRYSPDGTEISFVSDRSGNMELWKSDADGRRAVQLTAFDGPAVGAHRWSPDGQNIVFISVLAGQADIFAVNSSGGATRRLTNDPSQDVYPWWSQDGEWIYFDSQRTGEFHTFKMPAAGGEPVQAETDAIGQSKVSPDGMVLYYAEKESPYAVWSVPLAGGEPTQVVDATLRGQFDVVADGIYYAVQRTSTERFSVHFLRFATGAVEPIFQVDAEISTGISVAPDGHSILFGQEHYVANIMLVENFR